ncbi:MAG: SurA N-terminal domain-containing protein [Bacteroidales bacterium]
MLRDSSDRWGRVSYQDFDQRVQNLIEIYKMSGTNTISEEMTESLREQVWQQMVEDRVIGEHISDLGIGVSTEEVESMVLATILTRLYSSCLPTRRQVWLTAPSL